MKTSDCFSPGFIIKPHGLKGGITAKITLKNPDALAGMDVLFIEKAGQLVPFAMESISFKDTTAYIKFEDIHSQEEAAAFKGLKLFLPSDLFAHLVPDDSGTIIGYKVEDELAGYIGKITEIMQAGPQETLIIENEKVEILIPFVPHMVVLTDHVLRTVFTRCPEGLIDLYLTGGEDE